MKNRSRIKTIPVHLTTLIPLGPWYPVDTFGPLLVPWEHFVPLWPTLDLPVPFGPLLVALCPYGTLGAHIGIFLSTFGPLCAPLIPFGHLWATFGSHGPPWVTFEPIWYSCGPLWATLGPSVPLGTFGFIGNAFWSLWAPLCYLWPPLVHLEAYGPLCATFDILWALWYPVDPFGLLLVPLATFGYWSLIPFWGVLLSPLGHLSLSLYIYIYIYIYIFVFVYVYTSVDLCIYMHKERI